MGKLNKKGNKPRFYGVRSGRRVGIFLEWILCCESVDRYKSNNHQGYQDLDEAVSYLESAGIEHVNDHILRKKTHLN